MFETPKPRQFHYTPRFYDPEKERWEALKQKYADEHSEPQPDNTADTQNATEGDDLAYFQQKVRQLDRKKQAASARLGWKDLFRKRQMPQFNYTPRFNSDGTMKEPDTDIESSTTHKHNIKIRRRFDIGDPDYMKPVSGGKIILYCFLVCLLLYWVLF